MNGLWRLAEEPVPGGFTIGIDVDSVLFPINELVVLPYLHSFGYSIELEDITAFDYGDPEIKRLAFECFMREDLYDGHRPSELARQVLARLREHNRVIAVSSPFASHAGSKWAYCMRAGFKHSDIVLCGDKTLVDMDALVDDKAETVLELGNRRAVVFDRPWNKTVRGIPRARGWSEVIPALRKVLR
jgi:5'(3')-deoxyribonucleotidase